MLQKVFQMALVTFLVIFTAAGAVLLVSGLSSLFPQTANGGSIFMFAGGWSIPLVKIAVMALLFLVFSIGYLLLRASRLR